jgi:hypothetical protein
MKKIIIFGSLFVGVILLSGCSQQQQSTKIILPIDSREEACKAWDSLKITYFSSGPMICSNALDQGDFWEISSSGKGCGSCDGKINKQDGAISDKQCTIANTCKD